MKPEYLNNKEGIVFQKEYAVASAERAVADVLYFNPKTHLDATDSINWDRVKKIQDIVFT